MDEKTKAKFDKMDFEYDAGKKQRDAFVERLRLAQHDLLLEEHKRQNDLLAKIDKRLLRAVFDDSDVKRVFLDGEEVRDVTQAFVSIVSGKSNECLGKVCIVETDDGWVQLEDDLEVFVWEIDGKVKFHNFSQDKLAWKSGNVWWERVEDD